MDEAGVKAARRLLRIVNDHVRLLYQDRGARIEALDLVDVIVHPADPTPELNIVTPRRSTAWVAAGYIQPGLARLRELGRPPRVQYITGLYPPQFAVVLRDLGLQVEHEMPLMIWHAPTEPSPVAAQPDAPKPIQIQTAQDVPPPIWVEMVQSDYLRRLWRDTWRACYTSLYLLGDVTEDESTQTHEIDHAPPTVIDYVAAVGTQPVGAARLIMRLEIGSAQIAALTLAPDETAERRRDPGRTAPLDPLDAPTDASESPALAQAALQVGAAQAKPGSAAPKLPPKIARVEALCALLGAALGAAQRAGCKIVFVPAEDEEERRACRRMDFIDLSSIVRYAAPSRMEMHEHVAEAVFSTGRAISAD
jgi:hypothetical protein